MLMLINFLNNNEKSNSIQYSNMTQFFYINQHFPVLIWLIRVSINPMLLIIMSHTCYHLD